MKKSEKDIMSDIQKDFMDELESRNISIVAEETNPRTGGTVLTLQHGEIEWKAQGDTKLNALQAALTSANSQGISR